MNENIGMLTVDNELCELDDRRELSLLRRRGHHLA
jgi:hypothetical protein